MSRRPSFLPFPFRNTEDRIRLFSLLYTMRIDDYPIPETAGALLTLLSDEDIRKYVMDITSLCGERGQLVDPGLKEQAIEALDTLAYFHGLSCRGDGAACLGQEISRVIHDFTS